MAKTAPAEMPVKLKKTRKAKGGIHDDVNRSTGRESRCALELKLPKQPVQEVIGVTQ
jgi:hypothetical protein